MTEEQGDTIIAALAALHGDAGLVLDLGVWLLRFVAALLVFAIVAALVRK